MDAIDISKKLRADQVLTPETLDKGFSSESLVRRGQKCFSGTDVSSVWARAATAIKALKSHWRTNGPVVNRIGDRFDSVYPVALSVERLLSAKRTVGFVSARVVQGVHSKRPLPRD